MQEQEHMEQEARLQENATRLHVLVSTAVCPGVLKPAARCENAGPVQRDWVCKESKDGLSSGSICGRAASEQGSKKASCPSEDRIKQCALAVVASRRGGRVSRRTQHQKQTKGCGGGSTLRASVPFNVVTEAQRLDAHVKTLMIEELHGKDFKKRIRAGENVFRKVGPKHVCKDI
eukprot:jgi/Botrbrau1/23499/Bobra.106_1s0050.1